MFITIEALRVWRSAGLPVEILRKFPDGTYLVQVRGGN